MRPFQLDLAAKWVRSEGVIAYPTETVWGLGCLPQSRDAVFRLIQIKQRPIDKGVILLCSNAYQLSPWLMSLTSDDFDRVNQMEERPTTWILPSATAPDWITGGRQTIAVRVTQKPSIKQLCDRVGAIVSTSANRSGHPVVRTRMQCIRQFYQRVDYVLPGQCEPNAKPSRIIDFQSGKVLRD